MGQEQSPYPKTVETMPMSLVPGIPNPYVGAFAGDYFCSTGFCQTSFLPDIGATPQALNQVFAKEFCILLFSSTNSNGEGIIR